MWSQVDTERSNNDEPKQTFLLFHAKYSDSLPQWQEANAKVAEGKEEIEEIINIQEKTNEANRKQ